MIKKITLIVICLYTISILAADNKLGTVTGYKIPRFVSLKSDNVNLRIGSSINYPIVLNYITMNLPIEIIDEYKFWRKTKDIDGNIGWIHKNLIKGDRYVIFNKKALAYNMPEGSVMGEIGVNNLGKLNKCLLNWCLIKIENKKFWILKETIWGVYENEIFNRPLYQPLINYYWRIKKYILNLKIFYE